MIRLGILVTFVLAFAPSPAEALDCAATCGEVCQAVDASAFVRAEILSIEQGGYYSRVKIIERLGGDPSVDVQIGQELDQLYTQVPVVAGDHMFLTISRYDDRAETTLGSLAWPIRDGHVICDSHDPTVPLEQYVAMASSADCVDISVRLEIENTCGGRDGGCSTTGGSVDGFAGLLALVVLRRRRARQ